MKTEIYGPATRLKYTIKISHGGETLVNHLNLKIVENKGLSEYQLFYSLIFRRLFLNFSAKFLAVSLANDDFRVDC